MANRHIVTIDGLAGSGKTTISELLAKKLGYAHLNSGLLYRAVGWLTLQDAVDPSDISAVAELPLRHRILLRLDDSLSSKLSVDGQDLGREVYTEAVTEMTSITSQYAQLRQALIVSQREAFPGYCLVAEGRDMGTIVFKDAPIKFFVHTDLEVRVSRRLAQILKSKPDLSESEAKSMEGQVERDLSERDERDSKRAVAPTKPADDAIQIDNSSLPLTQVIQTMYDIVLDRARGSNPSG